MNCQSSIKESREKNNYFWPYINTRQIQLEYSLADFLLLPSDFSRNIFLSKGFSNKTLINITRGVDLIRFYPKRKNYKLIRVIFFGSVSERKGIYEALEAWKLANLENAELLVIGNIPKESLEKIKSLSVKNVKFFRFSDSSRKISTRRPYSNFTNIFRGHA